MIDFTLTRANSSAQAAELAAKSPTAQQGATVRFIGGGTTLVDLMKLDVEMPRQVIDINRLALAQVTRNADGSLWHTTRMYCAIIRCSRRRCSRAHRASCAIWRRPAATYSNARDALIFVILNLPSAINGLRARAAQQSSDTTGFMRCWARVNIASRRIRRIWPLP